MSRLGAETSAQSSFLCTSITSPVIPSDRAPLQSQGVLPLSAGVYVPPSSLVGLGITSSLSDVIDHTGVPACPDAGWLRGACEHGTIRWLPLTCKRRGCPVCGELRKKRIAWKISAGVEILGGAAGGAWLVLTFDRDVTKDEAVKIANQYMQWLYRYCKRQFGFKPEWAKVWELQESGRLHLNIVLAPWHFIPQKVLAGKWHDLGGGRIGWVERVGAEIGVEAAKSRRKVGNYLAKWDQMVLSGRGVSYSKGWPKLPDPVKVERIGRIRWGFVGSFSEESILHWYEAELGHWHEVVPGEWCSADGEDCHCFDYVDSG